LLSETHYVIVIVDDYSQVREDNRVGQHTLVDVDPSQVDQKNLCSNHVDKVEEGKKPGAIPTSSYLTVFVSIVIVNIYPHELQVKQSVARAREVKLFTGNTV
jgi:hypothetical protein